MFEGIRTFLLAIVPIVICIGIGAFVAFIFYNLKKRDLFGGYIGGLVVGVIGASIGVLLLDKLFYDISVKILDWLSRDAGVNIIAGFIGAYIALYIMNRLNHNRERRKF